MSVTRLRCRAAIIPCPPPVTSPPLRCPPPLFTIFRFFFIIFAQDAIHYRRRLLSLPITSPRHVILICHVTFDVMLIIH